MKVKGKEFGVLSDPTPIKLRVCKSYEILLVHCGSNREDGRDYDWDAFIGGNPNSPVKAPTYATAVFVHKGLTTSWIVDKRSGLLGRNDSGAIEETNEAEGRTAYFYPIGIIPDYNRDGKIDHADRGKITEDNPWRWWINDDNDTNVADTYGSESIPGQENGDNSVDEVNGKSDLVDFFPIYLELKGALEIYPSGEYSYILKQDNGALKYGEAPDLFPDGDPYVSAAGAYWRTEEEQPVIKVV